MSGTLDRPPIAREQLSEQLSPELLAELLASNSPLISAIQLSADLSALNSRTTQTHNCTPRQKTAIYGSVYGMTPKTPQKPPPTKPRQSSSLESCVLKS
jgi:hypothetical protein